MNIKHRAKFLTLFAAGVISCKTADQSGLLTEQISQPVSKFKGIKVEGDAATIKIARLLNLTEIDDAIFGEGTPRPQTARLNMKGRCFGDSTAGFEVADTDINKDGVNDVVGRMAVVWTYPVSASEEGIAVFNEKEFAIHSKKCAETSKKGVLASLSLHKRAVVEQGQIVMGDDDFNPHLLSFGSSFLGGSDVSRALFETSSNKQARALCASTLDVAGIKHSFHRNQVCDFNLTRDGVTLSSPAQKPLRAGEEVKIRLQPTDIYVFNIATVSSGTTAKQSDPRIVLAAPRAKGSKARETVIVKSNFNRDSGVVESARVYRLAGKPNGSEADFTIDESKLLFTLDSSATKTFERPRPAQPADENGIVQLPIGDIDEKSIPYTTALKAHQISCKAAFTMALSRAPSSLEARNCSVETDAGVTPVEFFSGPLLGNEATFSVSPFSKIVSEESLYEVNGAFGRLRVGGGKGYNRGAAIQELLLVVRIQ